VNSVFQYLSPGGHKVDLPFAVTASIFHIPRSINFVFDYNTAILSIFSQVVQVY